MKNWIVNFILGMLLALPCVVYADAATDPTTLDQQFPSCCPGCNSMKIPKCKPCKYFCNGSTCTGNDYTICFADCDAYSTDGQCPDVKKTGGIDTTEESD